jgi:hypothetical protein
MEVFAKKNIMLIRADIDKVNGGRAVNRQLKQGRVRIVRTPGNARIFDQLGEILPDENDIRKPAKIDADQNGVGGDDGADAFRYGIATKVRALQPAKKLAVKDANRAVPIATRVVDGHLEPAPPTPRTVEELADRMAERRAKSHLPRPDRRFSHTPKW